MAVRIRFGRNLAGNSTLIGNPNGKIRVIIVERDKRFTPNDFECALHRFGPVSATKNSDVQAAIQRLLLSPAIH